MNWINYLKFNEGVIPASILKAINLLFTDGESFGQSFLIGDEKYPIYGQMLSLISNSDVIANLPDFKESKIPLATMFQLTKINTPGFVYAWLTLNGFKIPLDAYSLKDLLIIREWLLYFGYFGSMKDLERNIMIGVQNSELLDSEERTLVEKMFEQKLKPFLNFENHLDSIDLEVTSDLLEILGKKLNISRDLDIDIGLRFFADGHTGSLINLLNKIKSLDEYKIKLANYVFDNLVKGIKQSSSGFYVQNRYNELLALGKILNRKVLPLEEYVR